MIPILDLTKQYEQIQTEVEKSVLEVLKSGQYICGKHNKALQEEFAQFCGCKRAVTLNSGTDALHLALRALNIGAGDEVITTAFTFVATTEAIGIVGATPIFADIDPKTFDIDPNSVEKILKKEKNVKAVICVHLYGLPCNMGELLKLKKKYKFVLIEDACQAHLAKYKNKTVGSIGDAGAFSFYATKNMTTGEGGAVLTNNSKIDKISDGKQYIETIYGGGYKLNI